MGWSTEAPRGIIEDVFNFNKRRRPHQFIHPERDLQGQMFDVRDFFPSVEPEEFFQSLDYALSLLAAEDDKLKWS